MCSNYKVKFTKACQNQMLNPNQTQNLREDKSWKSIKAFTSTLQHHPNLGALTQALKPLFEIFASKSFTDYNRLGKCLANKSYKDIEQHVFNNVLTEAMKTDEFFTADEYAELYVNDIFDAISCEYFEEMVNIIDDDTFVENTAEYTPPEPEPEEDDLDDFNFEELIASEQFVEFGGFLFL